VLLGHHHLSFENIITITLLLQDMSDFTLINPIYSTYFPFFLPPSRVTISTTFPEKVRLSAIISSLPRTGLHVQSRSYWAPANIGPYSQSISVPFL
jgi:diphthine-ammonia ligase